MLSSLIGGGFGWWANDADLKDMKGGTGVSAAKKSGTGTSVSSTLGKTTSTYTPHDHYGEFCFQVGNIRVGGAKNGGSTLKVDGVDLLLDLTVHVTKFTEPPSPPKVDLPEKYADLAPLLVPVVDKPEKLGIKWNDRQAPPYPLAFFKQLIDTMEKNLKEFNKGKTKKNHKKTASLVIACQGSHGRTGTAMAAILIACEGLSAKEAVEKVRKTHCWKAVESDAQAKWLVKVAGKGEKPGDLSPSDNVKK